MHEHAQGSSFRKISENLARKGISVNPSTVYRWVSHYGRSMDAYMNTITPRVGEQWHADEVMLTIGGVKTYLMSMIDGMTRFWLSSDMAPSKNTADAKMLFPECNGPCRKDSEYPSYRQTGRIRQGVS